MEKATLITVFILFNSLIAYCQRPYSQDLQSEARITFPDTPKVEFSDGASYYIYRSNNNDLYFAQVTNLNKINPDSLNTNVPDDIYAQFIGSVINPLKGKVFYTEKIKAGNLGGVAFDYKCKLNGNTYFGYEEVFHLNNDLVSYSLLSPDSVSKEDEKIESFFNTFRLTPKRAAELNKKSGILAGIFIIGAIFFWGAVAVYFIKRSRKKKSFEWPDGK
ncbi:MAG: hypothetical protein ACHQIM_09950 [Sphingobacteriales bacterium]